MAKHEKNSTAQNILERSMDLFNEVGVESISTNRVAETLEISPGNLTYHFKKKSDIVRALLDELEAELLDSLRDFPSVASPREFVDGYVKIFKTCWKYRGLFNSAPYLIQSHLVKASRFRALNAHVTSTLVKHCRGVIAKGHMLKVPAPFDLETLIDCIWWQWQGWLRVNQLLEPATQRLEFDEIVASGIRHTILLVSPYMRSTFAGEVLAVLRESHPRALKRSRPAAKVPQPAPKPRRQGRSRRV